MNAFAAVVMLCLLHSASILVSSSKVFQLLLDDYSAEILLLGCLVQQPDYVPALSSYGKLAACKVRLQCNGNLKPERGDASRLGSVWERAPLLYL